MAAVETKTTRVEITDDIEGEGETEEISTENMRKNQGCAASGATNEGEERGDPMIEFLSDENIIEMMSTLIAKMERPAFNEHRTSLFRTPWARTIFATCSKRILKEPFDIDEWYRGIISKNPRRTRRDIDPALYLQSIEVDWASALIELEMRASSSSVYINKNKSKKTTPSILRILYVMLEWEDRAQAKLAALCKVEQQYNFQGVSKPTISGQKLLQCEPSSSSSPSASGGDGVQTYAQTHIGGRRRSAAKALKEEMEAEDKKTTDSIIDDLLKRSRIK